jgi:hypothetical protein
MNHVETYPVDPVRERFRLKLQLLAATDDREEIAVLGRRLARIVDEIGPQGPHRPAGSRVVFS